MTEIAVLDRAFQVIMRRLVETGRAPHYTETDYITSFPPFNNLPTQYRITVHGEQKWFAQCGFEALSMTWVFPGEAVRVDAPCLD